MIYKYSLKYKLQKKVFIYIQKKNGSNLKIPLSLHDILCASVCDINFGGTIHLDLDFNKIIS